MPATRSMDSVQPALRHGEQILNAACFGAFIANFEQVPGQERGSAADANTCQMTLSSSTRKRFPLRNYDDGHACLERQVVCGRDVGGGGRRAAWACSQAPFRHDSCVVFRDEWVARSAPSKQARLTSERAKYKVRIFLGLSIIFPSGKRSISVKLAPPNDEHA